MFDGEYIRRFEAKYRKDESGCWLWIGALGKGYGMIKIPRTRKQIYAHRLSYLIHRGDIPGGIQVCHTCDTRNCVNPDHLFLGTCKDNLQDMKSKGRHLCGSKNAIAKLDEEQVRQIKIMLAAGIPQVKIAKVYDISQIQISRIKTGQRWTHVK